MLQTLLRWKKYDEMSDEQSLTLYLTKKRRFHFLKWLKKVEKLQGKAIRIINFLPLNAPVEK